MGFDSSDLQQIEFFPSKETIDFDSFGFSKIEFCLSHFSFLLFRIVFTLGGTTHFDTNRILNVIVWDDHPRFGFVAHFLALGFAQKRDRHQSQSSFAQHEAGVEARGGL